MGLYDISYIYSGYSGGEVILMYLAICNFGLGFFLFL